MSTECWQSHTHTQRRFRAGKQPWWGCIQLRPTGEDLGHPLALHVYSHFHHRAHVLYYLWSRSGTVHCSSPASYQEFAPGKLICGERIRGYLQGNSLAAQRLMRTISIEKNEVLEGWVQGSRWRVWVWGSEWDLNQVTRLIKEGGGKGLFNLTLKRKTGRLKLQRCSGLSQWGEHSVTHITTSGYMFHIVFGATLRLHITIIHLLIKYFNLEKCRGKATVRLGQLCTDRKSASP